MNQKIPKIDPRDSAWVYLQALKLAKLWIKRKWKFFLFRKNILSKVLFQ